MANSPIVAMANGPIVAMAWICQVFSRQTLYICLGSWAEGFSRVGQSCPQGRSADCQGL